MPGATPRSTVLPWVAYGVCAVVWGSTYFGIAVALESFPPYGMVAVRFSFAALLALGVGRLLREPLPKRAELPHLALVGVLLLGVCNALVVWAETRVSSGVAAVLAALTPAWFGVLRHGPSLSGGAGGRERASAWRASSCSSGRVQKAASTSAVWARSSWPPPCGRSGRFTTEST